MKKLNEKELAEVKGGFVGGLVDPSVNFIVLHNFTINKKHKNWFNWKKFLGLK